MERFLKNALNVQYSHIQWDQFQLVNLLQMFLFYVNINYSLPHKDNYTIPCWLCITLRVPVQSPEERQNVIFFFFLDYMFITDCQTNFCWPGKILWHSVRCSYKSSCMNITDCRIIFSHTVYSATKIADCDIQCSELTVSAACCSNTQGITRFLNHIHVIHTQQTVMRDGLVVDMLNRVKYLACYRLAKILTSIFLFQQSTQFFDMLDKMEVRKK